MISDSRRKTYLLTEKGREVLEEDVKLRKLMIQLAETGLLNGKKATTHHLALKMLQEKYPDIRVESDRKVIHDCNLITSGGVSSGINMALYLVEQTMGKSAAERTAKTIEFVL